MDIFSLPEGKRKTLASQLRKSASGNFGPGGGQVKLMSFGCRYSQAMIRIRHTHRAALNKNPVVIVGSWRRVYLRSICGVQVPWIALMISLMYYDSLRTSSFCCFLASKSLVLCISVAFEVWGAILSGWSPSSTPTRFQVSDWMLRTCWESLIFEGFP